MLDFVHQELLDQNEIDKMFFESTSMDDFPKRQNTSMGPKDSEIGVLAMHGLIGSPLDLMLLSTRLAQMGCRVLLPLLPGHGKNYEELHGIDHQEWIKYIDECIDVLKSEVDHRKIILLGHSMGGSLAIIHSGRRDDISGMVVLATPVRYNFFVHGVAKVLGTILSNIKLKYKDFIFDDQRLYDHPYIKMLNIDYGKVTISTLKEVIKLIEVADNETMSVDVPSLIIHSKKDKTVPVRNAYRIQNRIKSNNSKVVTLDQSYHVIIVDSDREVVITECLNFVKSFL